VNQHRDLVLMARAPEPGRTKTRLIPALGAEGAAFLAEAMLMDTLALADEESDVRLHVAIDQSRDAAWFAAACPEAHLFEQRGDTFGQRLANAMCDVSDGHNHVVALGTDCPHMPTDVLTEAWNCLANSTTDVVLGPASDGGYYLIGWSTPHPEIVEPVEMSTPRVLADTIELAQRDHLALHLLTSQFDIDQIDDVHRLLDMLANADASAPFTRAALERIVP